ncbi:MAG: PAS domain-containing protein [Burkholderiales bacterium]|nr:PAS domain-containing protein [Burkholderiales bacterium]
MSSLLENIFQDADTSLNVLQVLATNTFDSILITDATKDAKIVYANKAFKTLTGYAPSEVIGKTPRILQGAATDRKVIARLTDSLKRGGRFEGKAINYKKNGTPFIMYWRVLPVKVGNQIKVWVAIQREGYVI